MSRIPSTRARGGAAQRKNELGTLVAAFDACRSCELACTIAAEALTLSASSRTPHGLLVCAVICGNTAAALARLDIPDTSRVARELVACRAASALARLECENRPGDEIARRCAIECGKCEDRCGDALAQLQAAA